MSDLTGFIVTRVNRTSLYCVVLGQSGFGENLSGLKTASLNRVVLKIGENTALVKADIEDRKITIRNKFILLP